jgi:magnesium chelatase subunit I
MTRPSTLGELLASPLGKDASRKRSVKDELRENLIGKLREKAPIFPGVVGYGDSVIPQIVNAVLSRHNMILLGLRGQAKSRILRGLTEFLDEFSPAVSGCEINDNPFAPICRQCRDLIEKRGASTPIVWRSRDDRYVEKLATPDVTIADIIGDVDPIKAARGGHALGSDLSIHYGLLPRANRGIFALNELPDLAGKIQVGLFNIMQEGDVQIKGYPVRLPLDVILVFSANPEDYTARGKIVTPLKDRIGSEIKTHYPASLELGVTITEQEAWTARPGLDIAIPAFVRQIVEGIAFNARADQRVDKRSGVSQRLPITVLENVASNAERRAIVSGDTSIVARIGDIYAAIPAITGKMELEYEGELKGGEVIARDLIKQSVRAAFRLAYPNADFKPVTEFFESGGTLKFSDTDTAAAILGLMEHVPSLLTFVPAAAVAARVAQAEFILEGLYATDKIGRTEERGFVGVERRVPPQDLYRDYPMERSRQKNNPLN